MWFKSWGIAALEFCDRVLVLFLGRPGDSVLWQELLVVNTDIFLQIEVIFDNTDSENLSILILQSCGFEIKGVELLGFLLICVKLVELCLLKFSFLTIDSIGTLLVLVE